MGLGFFLTWRPMLNDMTDKEFGYWLSGLTDGEGSFGIYPQDKGGIRGYYFPRFSIHLRLDDIGILRMIKNRLGFGRLRFRPPMERVSPSCYYDVGHQNEALKLIKVFDECPLQSKKR